jgi:hypothetical protein
MDHELRLERRKRLRTGAPARGALKREGSMFMHKTIVTAFRQGTHHARCAAGLLAVTACSDPFELDTVALAAEEEEICAASEEWLPNTPALDRFKPLPHPAGECPFYRAGWQNFLIATQPDAQGSIALESYPTVDTLFESSKPRAATRAWLGDIKQAGGRQILIDQNGRTLYYGIHVNQAFADFVIENGMTTVDGVLSASPSLFFPAGVVEFKSAWQDISGEPAAEYANYIKTTALVPRLSQGANGQIREDKNDPREVPVALLALHVVFTLPGHPEFIWATFEHTDGSPDTSAKDLKRDVAPTTPGQNPPLEDPDNLRDASIISPLDHVLFKAGTRANQGNQPILEADLRLDEATQSFPGQQTSIYRMFPASKSNTTDPDAAINSLNFNVQTLFARRAPSDLRGYYRLVGAVWMDKPEYFGLNSRLNNDDSSPLVQQNGNATRRAAALEDLRINGGDSDYSLLAGEDRLSSTAMESFTQGQGSFPNCFTCHNTQAVTTRGIPVDKDTTSPVVLQPKLLNVSHVMSQFVLQEMASE